MILMNALTQRTVREGETGTARCRPSGSDKGKLGDPSCKLRVPLRRQRVIRPWQGEQSEMDENKNQIDQHKLNQNGMKLVGVEAGDPVEREAGNQLPSLDFLGEVDLPIGGVTL